MPALLAVLAAFMAGLALGAWAISRIVVRNCGRCYAWLELGIGTWAVSTAVLLPVTNRLTLSWIGLEPSPVRHWLIAFIVPLVVLLPATACMGATLPVIERFITPRTVQRRSIAGLYAANTFGAVVGVFASAFLVVPQFGLRAALFGFAAVNICCGVIAFGLARAPASPGNEEIENPAKPQLWFTLFVTGLLGIGYEVVGVRLLAQVLEGTVYTYAAVLAIFLLGTSFGAAVYQRVGQRAQLADLLSLTALACVIGILGATQTDELYHFLRGRLSKGMAGVLISEIGVAAVVFFLPTAFMGATFSHLAHLARQAPGGIGRALAINTLGAAGAPLVFSVLMLPWFGSKWTLLVIAGSYAMIARTLRSWRWVAVASVALLALLPAVQLRFLTVPTGGRVLAFQEGVMASVAVVEDAMAHKSLRVDNRFQMGGTGVAEAEYRHAHIPLLLHPKPKRALFLGLGTGITFDAAALHPDLTADGVELLREVVDVMPQFSPYNDSVRTNTRLAVFVADARRFVRGTTNIYDVIVGDLFHPARDGAGSLYTVEHFRGIRERLVRGGGLFCQWLPLHQLDADTLRVVIRTFLEVFPNAQAWLLRFNVETPVIGLIGATGTITYTPDWIEKRDQLPSLAERLQKLALADSLRLFGNILCDPADLATLAGPARINTDDNSAVLFGAPGFIYRSDSRAQNPLTIFLEIQRTNTATLLGFKSADLERFITARNVFLRGLIEESYGRMAEACERYVESARISDNFTAGYARAITIAAAEVKSDPEKSRKLLEQLIEAQPARPVAKQLLGRLFPKSEP